MLTQIHCDAFGDVKTIPFGAGLNIIQGYSGDTEGQSGNSIGKSSFLKIVDYAFGGDYYATSNDDIIKHVGDHDICFTHTFGDKHFYYRRNAKQAKKVFACDNNYSIQREIRIEDFQEELLKQYCLKDRGLTLRQFIGLYVRVWNRQNKEVDRPLHKYNGHAVGSAIIDLVKLFDMYNPISELEQQNTYLQKRRKALNAAVEYRLIEIPKNSGEYNRLVKTLNEMNIKIDQLKQNMSAFNVQNGSIINEKYNTLLERRRDLLREQGRCQRELRRSRKNIESIHPLNQLAFNQLKEYFPEVNLDRIEEVQCFHDGLRSILKSELQKESAAFEEKLVGINALISENEKNIALSSKLPTQADEAFAVLAKAMQEKEKLQEKINLFKDKAIDTSQKKENLEELTRQLSVITQDIQTKINETIEALSSEIDTSNNKPPVFELSPTQYSFGVHDNTGTGKAFTDLIIFDLAVLSLTDLPILVHDSFLFNNIDSSTTQNILKIYNKFNEKQIFIALDNYLGQDNEDVDNILRSKTRLFLSGSRMLFGKDWRT